MRQLACACKQRRGIEAGKIASLDSAKATVLAVVPAPDGSKGLRAVGRGGCRQAGSRVPHR